MFYFGLERQERSLFFASNATEDLSYMYNNLVGQGSAWPILIIVLIVAILTSYFVRAFQSSFKNASRIITVAFGTVLIPLIVASAIFLVAHSENPGQDGAGMLIQVGKEMTLLILPFTFLVSVATLLLNKKY